MMGLSARHKHVTEGRMRVFVTGGSGFLGGAVIRALAARGDTAVGLARSAAAVAAVTAAGGTAVYGDLDDMDAIRQGVADADVVVHAAAKLTGGPGDAAEFHRVNVAGTDNVLTAAGGRQLVYVSTEQVIMSRGPLVNADETWPYPDRSIGLYAATKQAAERRVLSAGGVAVRPRMVWGVGDTTLLPTVVEAVQAGRLRWIGGGRQLTSTCHVGNAVAGILAAAERGRPGEAYFLTDGAPVVFREFWTALLATHGVPAPDGTLPRRAAMAAATALETAWRLLRRPGAPPLDAKARQQLGYRAPVSREDGLAELRAAAAEPGGPHGCEGTGSAGGPEPADGSPTPSTEGYGDE
jgi:nucleoside-diphosphate-sugar epimerase